MTRAKAILSSIFLGAGTLAAIRGIGQLPFSPVRDAIVDILTMPGGFLAAVFIPFGVHGGGATFWAWFVFLGNLAFYSTIWALILVLFAKAGSK